MEQSKTPTRQLLATYGYMGMWIVCSAAVIMVNKYILDPKLGGFPFPLTLTCIHMAFCTVLSWTLVKTGFVQAVDMPMQVYISSVLPVGALFAVVLWLGNAAYLYLSVSFIQMLKASMPMVVYSTALCFKVEAPCKRTFLNMVVVVSGIVLASYGEVVFIAIGVACQVASIFAEAIRLILVQILLQRKGIKLNPVTTMCYVAPSCLLCLLLPFAVVEAGTVTSYTGAKVGPGLLLGSAALAFALNCSVFLLIGKSSALTMNIAGIVKDLMLIGLSVLLYKSIVTSTQVIGYSIALAGVFYYNYRKIQATQEQAVADKQQPKGRPPDEEKQKLLDTKGSKDGEA